MFFVTTIRHNAHVWPRAEMRRLQNGDYFKIALAARNTQTLQKRCKGFMLTSCRDLQSLMSAAKMLKKGSARATTSSW